jgi:hypothetical protein
MNVFLTFSVYVFALSSSVIYITKFVTILTSPVLYPGEPAKFTQDHCMAEQPSNRCYPQIFLIPFEKGEIRDKGERFAFSGYFSPSVVV